MLVWREKKSIEIIALLDENSCSRSSRVDRERELNISLQYIYTFQLNLLKNLSRSVCLGTASRLFFVCLSVRGKRSANSDSGLGGVCVSKFNSQLDTGTGSRQTIHQLSCPPNVGYGVGRDFLINGLDREETETKSCLLRLFLIYIQNTTINQSD